MSSRKDLEWFEKEFDSIDNIFKKLTSYKSTVEKNEELEEIISDVYFLRKDIRKEYKRKSREPEYYLAKEIFEYLSNFKTKEWMEREASIVAEIKDLLKDPRFVKFLLKRLDGYHHEMGLEKVLKVDLLKYSNLNYDFSGFENFKEIKKETKKWVYNEFPICYKCLKDFNDFNSPLKDISYKTLNLVLRQGNYEVVIEQLTRDKKFSEKKCGDIFVNKMDELIESLENIHNKTMVFISENE